MALIWLQVQNFYYGLTTNERFGRDAIKLEEQIQNFAHESSRLQAVGVSVLEREMRLQGY